MRGAGLGTRLTNNHALCKFISQLQRVRRGVCVSDRRPCYASCGSSRQRLRRGCVCLSLTSDHASCGSNRQSVRRGGVCVSDRRPCFVRV